MSENSNEIVTQTNRVRRFYSKKTLLGCLILTLAVYSLSRSWQADGDRSRLKAVAAVQLSTPPAKAQNTKAEASGTIQLTAGESGTKELTEDEQNRIKVLGTWEDFYEGHRIMTLLEDGTGTMVVELDGIAARLFAPRLLFNMKWSIKEGRLEQWSLGGEPTGKVKMVLRTFGDKVNQPILELTEDRLLLLDKDGETQYDFRRVTE